MGHPALLQFQKWLVCRLRLLSGKHTEGEAADLKSGISTRDTCSKHAASHVNINKGLTLVKILFKSSHVTQLLP